MQRLESAGARAVMERLAAAGYEAYLIGGCVRDSLMGRAPHDWDVATDAEPEAVLSVFGGQRVIETGLKHGTVTVLCGDEPVEVTTYRVDGEYSDGRRPDGVRFTRSLREDVSRRDFTINALAWNPSEGVLDLVGGEKDLEDGIIRCIGDADQRFSEDGLRILRALRFASELGFSIESGTKAAIFRQLPLLGRVSEERKTSELLRLLCGKNVLSVLEEYAEVVFALIPELRPTLGCLQNNPYHCYDVWNHIIHTVENIEPDPLLRLTMLLHDIGKPAANEASGIFFGHPEEGAKIAAGILERLRLDRKTQKTVLTLITVHDVKIPPDSRAEVRRWLGRLGEENLRRLVKIKFADNRAKRPEVWQARRPGFEALSALAEEVIASGCCCRLDQLAVDGKDLLSIGIPAGEALGQMLESLLGRVISEELPNEREALLCAAREALPQIAKPF